MTTQTEALNALIHEMEYVLSCINGDKIPFDGDDFHEALRLGKEALAQPEQEPLPNLYVKDINGNFHPYKEKGHTENCAAFGDDCSENHLPTSRVGVGENDYTAKPEQEPVAWIDASSFAMMNQDPRFNCVQWQTTLTLSQVYEGQIPFYTTPPQRTWVGLTDEEVKDIVWNLPYEPTQEHIRAIEAKLKEKNTK